MVIPNEVVFPEVEAAIARGETATLPFKGRSMEPYLREGDRIRLRPVGRVRRGDVLLFRHQGQYLLHRCRARWGGRCLMRGDASRRSELVGREAVVACLEEVQPPRRDWVGLRCRMAPWYFLALAILMWGYFGPVPIASNFVLGIRMDHLVHASVYLPCSWFILRRRPWLLACGVGLLTESVQYLLPYRGFDINDLVANMLGVLLGWLILHLFLCNPKK